MLRRFTCCDCGTVELRTGGTTLHRCASCRVAKGLPPGRTKQQEAHRQVAQAQRLGKLSSPRAQTCADCAAPAVEYDHRDYDKPLQVAAVCRRCNLRRGPALNKA